MLSVPSVGHGACTLPPRDVPTRRALEALGTRRFTPCVRRPPYRCALVWTAAVGAPCPTNAEIPMRSEDAVGESGIG